jgi:hypothetical protein
MVRATLNDRSESLEVCDRYFVKRMGFTSYDGVVARSELCARETEETGRSLGEILADLRVAGSL